MRFIGEFFGRLFCGVSIKKLQSDNQVLLQEVTEAKSEIDHKNQTIHELQLKIVEQNAKIDSQQEFLKNTEKQQINMSMQFENLANKMLEEKSSKMQENSKKALNETLLPLREQLTGFKNRIEQINTESTKERARLEEHIEKVLKATSNVQNEAHSLTTALKGDAKKQGIWGEMQLARILELSGLEEGREYTLQESFQTEDGRRLPDAVVYFPGNRSIIVDSKVSLVAYTDYISADTPAEEDQAIKRHLQSLESHIKDLSSKSYQQLLDSNPQYVLMFIPIEGAFSLAEKNRKTLVSEALDKKVVIATPTTLLAILKTVESIWKVEKQNMNALEIAQKGGALYDKLKTFTDSYLKIGKAIINLEESYETGRRQLSEGPGNAIKRASELKEMGAITDKEIDKKLITSMTFAEDEPAALEDSSTYQPTKPIEQQPSQ